MYVYIDHNGIRIAIRAFLWIHLTIPSGSPLQANPPSTTTATNTSVAASEKNKTPRGNLMNSLWFDWFLGMFSIAIVLWAVWEAWHYFTKDRLHRQRTERLHGDVWGGGIMNIYRAIKHPRYNRWDIQKKGMF